MTPSQNPDPNLPRPDSSLWIMHYCQTDPGHQIPSRNLQIADQTRQMMNERVQLQRYGQLVRKEFMLRDSASWPTINLPGNPGTAHTQQAMGYPNDVMAHMNRSQQQAYMQQQQANAHQRGIGPSPAKRPRHGAPGHGHGSATAIPAPIVSQDSINEDEDGTVGGDYMDYLTPREISIYRYIQHHEWLGQILESPFDINQIIPGDLGLGRKGELESLTRDFFDAPVNGTPKGTPFNKESVPGEKDSSTVPPRVGRLEAGRAEDFTKRATEKVAQINSEMENLKRQHAKRMGKLQKLRSLKAAEESVRSETLEILNGDAAKMEVRQDDKIVDIAKNVFGKGVQPIQDVECLQKGGLEEKSDGKETNDQDYDMVDNNFNLDSTLDESQPPILAVSAAQISPSNRADSGSPIPHNHAAESTTIESAVNEEPADMNALTASRDPAPEDWIMVNKDGDPTSGDQDVDLGDIDSFVNDAAMQSNIHTPSAMADTADDHPQGLEQSTENPSTEPFEHDGGGEHHAEDFSTNDFGGELEFDLDTAGAGLSEFDQANESVGLGEHDAMEASDAFGDAFPTMEPSASNEAPNP